MSDIKYESEPVEVWEYRNTQCALYCLRIPDDSRWVGYAQFADEWIEVLDRNGMDPSGDPDRMKQRVEDEVDSIVRDIVRDEVNDLDFPFGDDPIDPNPGIDPIDPNPNPNPYPPNDDPFPPGPTWMSTISGVPVVTTGTVSVATTSGTEELVSLSDLDADDITEDGLLDD